MTYCEIKGGGNGYENFDARGGYTKFNAGTVSAKMCIICF